MQFLTTGMIIEHKMIKLKLIPGDIDFDFT